MTNAPRLLPYQTFYVRHANKHEFNLGMAYDVNPNTTITLDSLESAVKNVVQAQPYLRSVYHCESNQLRLIETGSAYTVNEYRFNTVPDNVSSWLDTLITRSSKILSYEHGPLLSVGLCHLGNQQVVFIVVDHFAVDGYSMAILPLQLERQLFGAKGFRLPTESTFTLFEDELDQRQAGITSERLSYWRRKTVLRFNDPSNINGNQRVVQSRLSAQETRIVLQAIRKQRQSFDIYMIAAFNTSYAEITGSLPESIMIMQDFRTYLGKPQFWKIVGNLSFGFPIFWDNTEALELSIVLAQVKNVFETISDKEPDYILGLYNPKHPGLVSDDIPIIEYSYIGNIGKISGWAKRLSFSKHFDTYFHGKTFSPDMPCYREIFIRPFIAQKQLFVTLYYNHLQHSNVIMQTLADRSIHYLMEVTGVQTR